MVPGGHATHALSCTRSYALQSLLTHVLFWRRSFSAHVIGRQAPIPVPKPYPGLSPAALAVPLGQAVHLTVHNSP